MSEPPRLRQPPSNRLFGALFIAGAVVGLIGNGAPSAHRRPRRRRHRPGDRVQWCVGRDPPGDHRRHPPGRRRLRRPDRGPDAPRRAGPLARLGLAAALIGGAVVTISIAIDGFSMKAPSVAAAGRRRTGRGRRHAGRRRRQQRRLRHLERRHARVLRSGLRLLRGRRRRESPLPGVVRLDRRPRRPSDPGSRPSSGSAPASRRSRPRPCSSSRP